MSAGKDRMAQLREIRRRIRSVHETQKITRAMKMVAAAKLRRAQEAMQAMRPYAQRLRTLIGRIALDIFGDEHPLFLARKERKGASGTLVIAGDKGLCGGFNSNLIRFSLQHMAAKKGAPQQVWTVGKRATSSMRKAGYEIVANYHDVFDSLSYPFSQGLCDQFVDRYMKGSLDSVSMVYNEFITVMSQKLVERPLLPIDFDEIRATRREEELKRREAGDEKRRDLYEVEPNAEAALRVLVGRLLATQVHHALLESYAAELGARMSAMDNATNNASEMIESLTMEFNRARQTAITAELLDIVGGAAGLGG